jgi:hypothetical protein
LIYRGCEVALQGGRQRTYVVWQLKSCHIFPAPFAFDEPPIFFGNDTELPNGKIMAQISTYIMKKEAFLNVVTKLGGQNDSNVVYKQNDVQRNVIISGKIAPQLY